MPLPPPNDRITSSCQAPLVVYATSNHGLFISAIKLHSNGESDTLETATKTCRGTPLLSDVEMTVNPTHFGGIEDFTAEIRKRAAATRDAVTKTSAVRCLIARGI